MQVFAIVPAAGLGTRMAGPQPKQFLALDGVPILIHSLRAFAAAPRVTAMYVAVRRPEMERVEAQIAEYGFAGTFVVRNPLSSNAEQSSAFGPLSPAPLVSALPAIPPVQLPICAPYADVVWFMCVCRYHRPLSIALFTSTGKLGGGALSEV